MDNLGFFDSAVESELSKSGIYASVTRGVSMRPLFKTNRDMVILKKPDAELKKYDVVLYKLDSGRFVLHRIIKVLPNKYIIRGDNTFNLEHVPKDRILAVLSEFNRSGRRGSTSDIGYRVYSRIWTFIYPIRFLVHKSLNLARKVYRRIFKRN